MPIAAAIGAGATVFGSMLNSRSQSRTNAMNYKIAQMNNEFNEKMMQKQMDYNTSMWNKENEYNSAANQVKRLREAGLNPYLALGNAGSAGSAGSVTPAQAQPVTMQAPHIDSTGISQSLQYYAEMKMRKQLQDEQVKALQIDNMSRAQKNLLELKKATQELRGLTSDADIKEINRAWADKMQSIDYDNKRQQYESAKQETQMKINQNLMLSKELAIFDQQKRIELANIVSSTLLNNAQRFQAYTQGKLNQKEAKKVQAETEKVVAEHLLVTAKEKGQHISNEVAAKSAYYLVHKAYKEAFAPTNPFDVTWQIDHNISEKIKPSY